jgi:hypothetical protein
MSSVHVPYRLQVPATLETQLLDFRRRVWTIKLLEALGVAAFSIGLAYLCTFVFDRLWDTPVWVRTAVLAAALGSCLIAPYYVHRWIWSQRRLEQLARLLSRKLPRIGDQLLGVIELAHSQSEQARSPALCKAAIEQVAHDAAQRDFRTAAPTSYHRLWSVLSAAVFIAALALLGLFPSAAGNAWARFIMPWGNTPRYTFTAIQPLPTSIIVPHGEPFTVVAKLNAASHWHPAQGRAQLGEQPAVTTDLQNDQYTFQMPGQIEPGALQLSIGDWTQTVLIDPQLRPELTSVVAHIKLPDYLGRPEPLESDVRGGSISLVQGSQATFVATASRPLHSAQIDGQPTQPNGAAISTGEITVDQSKQVALQWQDEFGLAGKDAFKLSIVAHEDEPPSLSVEDLPRQKVVLDSEQLVFKVKIHDDFGVKDAGMSWKPLAPQSVEKPAKGECMLGAGGYDQTALELTGTFSAKALGIEPQPIQLRVFAEDYFPNRERVYSAPYTFYVLSPEQHAIWMTEQLSKWHRMALEVRDRELQLYETNKQLRALSPEQLDQPENRRRLETQASAERMNGRRLSNLTIAGEELTKEAARNPQIDADQLETWAQMLQILKDISTNRMPSVADLLKQAAQAPNAVTGAPIKASSGPMAGQSRAGGNPSTLPKGDENAKAPPAVPRIADMESSQEPTDDKGSSKPTQPKPPSAPRLGLPVTTLMGKPSNNNNANNTPAGQKVDQAIAQQKDLLAEFEKVADQLNTVLANLEGSTLVKRLKSASRKQYVVSGKISDQLSDSFGVDPAQTKAEDTKIFDDLAQQELKSSTDVSYIMDDMQAYFERRHLAAFKSVLDDMRTQDVIGSLRKLSDDVPKDHGLSISQCEFWSDTLDRWAEDLVDAACCGQCNCRPRGSLPPAIVLEVLQILEGEVNLREDTRVAEQAKAAVDAEKHKTVADKLSGTQHDLADRVSKVIDRIRELPEGDSEFAPEIKLLGQVNGVMTEANEILARPETGSPAIAAETEAIELLLRSKRINPKGGGSGGANPGGGGGGTTNDLALALLGSGVNQKEVRQDHSVSQSVGHTGPTLPEEFRDGLNEYFSRLESNDQ